MSLIVYVVIAVVVVALIAAAVAIALQQRSNRLKTRFGPEYQRAVESQGGNRGAAERELSGRVNRRKQLQITPLAEPDRQRYLAAWQQVQANFVDAPAESLRDADGLVARVMSDRGYPMGEFEQQAADISVDHPQVVDNYRGAHAVFLNCARGQATTEDLRRAMTQYRALFEELLHPAAPGGDGQQPAQEPAYAGGPSAASTGQQPPPLPPAGQQPGASR
jgi:hypothetical protein